MKYAFNRTIRRERGCAEKPGLCNLIGDAEEVKGRSTRNSNASGKAEECAVVQ